MTCHNTLTARLWCMLYQNTGIKPTGRPTKCSHYAPVWADDPWALDGKEPSDNKYSQNPGYNLWITPQLKKVAADIANSLWVGQTNLKRNNEVRNLGVVMDTSLSWQSHMQRSSSRMNSALIHLTRIKHLILRSDLRHAIQALALNHRHYCTLVWSTAGTSATASIRRSLRMAERLACSQFKDLGLMCRETMKVLHNRVTQKRSSYYINNCLLLNPPPRVEQ